MWVLLPHMTAFAGLVVLLVTSTYGLDSMCDVTQDAACHSALGGPVYLQLMRNTRGHDLSLYHDGARVFMFRRSKSVFSNEFNTPSFLQRWQFVPDNGTMIINPAERRDAGTYRVVIFSESTGRSVGDHTVQLTIEAPVSDVELSITCSAYGERRVMCSSNGDSPQYSWFLNGKPLNETSSNQCTEKLANSTSAEAPQPSPGCSTDLLEGTQGNLTCSARNNISSANKTQPLPSCTTTTTPTTTPTAPTAMTTNNRVSMATNKPISTQNNRIESRGQQIRIYVFISVIIILTSLLVGGYYLYIRNRRSHTPGGASMTAGGGQAPECPPIALTLVSPPSDERKDQEAQSTIAPTLLSPSDERKDQEAQSTIAPTLSPPSDERKDQEAKSTIAPTLLSPSDERKDQEAQSDLHESQEEDTRGDADAVTPLVQRGSNCSDSPLVQRRYSYCDSPLVQRGSSCSDSPLVQRGSSCSDPIGPEEVQMQ